MFWEKKEKKDSDRLPDLPPVPGSRPQMPPIRTEIKGMNKPMLSELPSLDTHVNISEEFTPRTRLPELPKFNNERKIEEEMPQEEEFEVIHPRINLPKSREFRETREIHEPHEAGPIFVKLEKFKSAKASLVKIHEKLREMDELLKTIREIRTKEESELDFWEKETDALKARLDLITRDLFDKVE